MPKDKRYIQADSWSDERTLSIRVQQSSEIKLKRIKLRVKVFEYRMKVGHVHKYGAIHFSI